MLHGGIDVHAHLDMPFGGTTSADDFETGTRAAAFGGTTTLIDFAIQYKGQPLRQAFDRWMGKAAGKAVCDYAFHCIMTDVSSGQLAEMNHPFHEGVTSFRLFMAYPGMPGVLFRGRFVVDGDKFDGRTGQGEFLRRSTYAQVNA